MKKITLSELDHILHFVNKPGRYIGKEINSIQKPFSNNILKTVLCYPDIYEVGMSNFSLRILYELINSSPDMLAERVFLPDSDMQTIMNKNSIPLFSLESKRPVRDFDILGFTIQYELNYLHLLQILKLSKISIWATDRTEKDPLIIAGGAGLANPEPVADFIDLFLIGEADDILISLFNKILTWKKKKKSKNYILQNLNKLDYIYIPQMNLKKTYRHIVPDLNKTHHPVKQIVPLVDIIQNRGIIEIDRGCINNCRFCQAGYYYRPKRERDIDNILNISERLIQHTGYNIITLLSLSISNYSQISRLIKLLNLKFQNKGISFSLPSIRIDKFTLGLLDEVSIVRKSGLTFALETADINIQKAINKYQDIDNFIETLMEVARKKWRTVKIYLMIGFEKSHNEVIKIQELIDKIINRLKQKNLYLKINLHISPLIKKPLTPLEKDPQIDFKIISSKINSLKNIFYSKQYKRWLKLKGHNLEESWLDAVLSRADRKISKVLYYMLNRNPVPWNNINIDEWTEAFKENHINPEDYLYNTEYLLNNIPWKNINFGYTDSFFKNELEKFNKKKINPGCIDNVCYHCGICNKAVKNIKAKITVENIHIKKQSYQNNKRFKYLLKFRKKGFFKYISHRDLIGVFDKIFRMINIPIIYTQGFNKRMKMSMLFTPPLMVEGENEVLQFNTYKIIKEKSIIQKINNIIKDDNFKIKKIIKINNSNKISHLGFDHSEYRITFTNAALYKTALINIRQSNIHYKKLENLVLIITLSKDRSITKLLQKICLKEFPQLWQDIKSITRNKIY